MEDLSKRGIFEMITARASAESHFIDISLVDRKAPAHCQPKFVVDTAESFSLQHRASENKRATSGALMAFPLSQCQLSPDVSLSEVDEIDSSELPNQMDHEMRSLHSLNPTRC